MVKKKPIARLRTQIASNIPAFATNKHAQICLISVFLIQFDKMKIHNESNKTNKYI